MTKVYVICNPIAENYYLFFGALNAFLVDDNNEDKEYAFTTNIEEARKWKHAAALIAYCKKRNLKILG